MWTFHDVIAVTGVQLELKDFKSCLPLAMPDVGQLEAGVEVT